VRVARIRATLSKVRALPFWNVTVVVSLRPKVNTISGPVLDMLADLDTLGNNELKRASGS